MYLLAWLPDVKHFYNVKRIIAYVCLSPEERPSSIWKGKARLSEIGHALYMPAASVMRTKQGALRALADRLRVKGKPGKVIVGALMRKPLHFVYGVLKSQQPFNPLLALARE